MKFVGSHTSYDRWDKETKWEEIEADSMEQAMEIFIKKNTGDPEYPEEDSYQLVEWRKEKRHQKDWDGAEALISAHEEDLFAVGNKKKEVRAALEVFKEQGNGYGY